MASWKVLPIFLSLFSHRTLKLVQGPGKSSSNSFPFFCNFLPFSIKKTVPQVWSLKIFLNINSFSSIPAFPIKNVTWVLMEIPCHFMSHNHEPLYFIVYSMETIFFICIFLSRHRAYGELHGTRCMTDVIDENIIIFMEQKSTYNDCCPQLKQRVSFISI